MASFLEETLALLLDEHHFPEGKSRQEYQRNRNIWAEHGLPKPMQENWRYTPIAAHLEKENPVLIAQNDYGQEGIKNIERIRNSTRLVFVNSRYAPTLSDATLPKGVSFKEGIVDLAAFPDAEKHPFLALNATMQNRAGHIFIEKNMILAQPLHIAFYTKGTKDNHLPLSSPRLSIELEEGAHATILETHQGEGRYFTNVASLSIVKKAAKLNHYILQDDSSEAYHTGFSLVRNAEKSCYESFVAQKGSRLARRDINVTLEGEDSACILNGLYHVDNDRHIDNATYIEHKVANCQSSEEYRAIVEGHGKGVFQGKIFVHPEAQQTEGYQMSRALLLSDNAEINHKPELEIYADDVKCSHGSTVSSVDPTQLFYLKSRGISKENAQKLLLQGFFSEIIASVTHRESCDFFKKAFGLSDPS